MKLLVSSNPKPGREDEYNDWYDNVHLADILAIPGMVRAQRLRAVPKDSDDPAAQERSYLAIYEFDADYAEIRRELGARAADGRMPMSDALDIENISLTAYEEI